MLHYYEITCPEFDEDWRRLLDGLDDLPGVCNHEASRQHPHIAFEAPPALAKRLRLLAQAHGGKLYYGGPADGSLAHCQHNIPRSMPCPLCAYSPEPAFDALADGVDTGCNCLTAPVAQPCPLHGPKQDALQANASALAAMPQGVTNG